MKKVLFCLLALAAFAAANTCTKAWYEIHAFNFLSIKDAPHLDSIYYREQSAPEEVHEWYQKYYYKDGLIHHSVFKFRDNDPVDNRIYLSADEATLTRSGRSCYCQILSRATRSTFSRRCTIAASWFRRSSTS